VDRLVERDDTAMLHVTGVTTDFQLYIAELMKMWEFVAEYCRMLQFVGELQQL
jgi:hypothetical protein